MKMTVVRPRRSTGVAGVVAVVLVLVGLVSHLHAQDPQDNLIAQAFLVFGPESDVATLSPSASASIYIAPLPISWAERLASPCEADPRLDMRTRGLELGAFTDLTGASITSAPRFTCLDGMLSFTNESDLLDRALLSASNTSSSFVIRPRMGLHSPQHI